MEYLLHPSILRNSGKRRAATHDSEAAFSLAIAALRALSRPFGIGLTPHELFPCGDDRDVTYDDDVFAAVLHSDRLQRFKCRAAEVRADAATRQH